MLLSTAARSFLRQHGRQTLLKAATARSFSSSLAATTTTTTTSRTTWSTTTTTPPKAAFFFSTSAASSSSSNTQGRDAYQISQTVQGTDACQRVGLDQLGITGPTKLYRNLTYQQLFDHEVANKEGVVAHAEYGDTFTVDTGKFTGRSPKDRWIVLNPGSATAEHMDWNDINQSTTPAVFEELMDKAVQYFNTRETAYVFDGYCGANPASRKNIRFVHEMAWQQHFGELLLLFFFVVVVVLFLIFCFLVLFVVAWQLDSHAHTSMKIFCYSLVLFLLFTDSHQHVHSTRNAKRN